MPQPLVLDPNDIRIAMLGMVDGNGHPYSWSAIFNGYNREVMAHCPYPGIPEYLNAQPTDAFGIAGARVTHLWCDDPAEAEDVAKASLIDEIVSDPLDVIGQVDAVIIPTDKGEEHLDRARPFIEAGIPVFIDKPLTIVEDHLVQFIGWQREGKPILSTSCMRYAKEFEIARKKQMMIGEPRLIIMTTPKSWERYGIHALEAVYPFLDPGGYIDVLNTGSESSNIVHIRHESGVDTVLAAFGDMYGAFGCMNVYGTDGVLTKQFEDTFFAFKAQLVAFVEYLKTGNLPFSFEETVELMKIVIAGIKSREEGNRRVALSEVANGSS